MNIDNEDGTYGNPNTAVGMKVTIDVGDYDLHSALSVALLAEVKRLGLSLDSLVKDRIEEALGESIAKLTDEAVAKAVDKLVTEGTPITTQYGEPTGRVMTLEQRVRERLFAQRGGFHDPIERVFEETLKRELAGDLGKLLAEAKAELRKALDSGIQKKLREAVGEAFK